MDSKTFGTYQELLDILKELTPEQLKETSWFNGENFYPMGLLTDHTDLKGKKRLVIVPHWSQCHTENP